MSYGFYFDQTSCIGCRACQIACKDKNDLPVGPMFRQVKTYECGVFPQSSFYHMAVTCNHCEEPQCLAVCPQGAYSKDEATGAIIHDDELCIGCKTCMNACPYDVPQYMDDLNIVQKCDMCFDLISAGEEPICIGSCVMRALEWGDYNELKAKHSEAVVGVPAWPDGNTDPHCLFTVKEAAKETEFEAKLI